MDELKQKILSMFKEKGSEISTSEILINLHPELKPIKEKEDVSSKRTIAKEHRKLLYHINELVNFGLIRFTKFGEHGSKFFVLNIGDEEEISELVKGFKKRVVLSRPAIPAMPIENYEQQKIIMRYEASSWVDKLNSVIINCNKLQSVKDLRKIFDKSMSFINDCLCFDNFEKIINITEEEELKNFIELLISETKDYSKKINFNINIAFIKNQNFTRIIEGLLRSGKGTVSFIYSINSEELHAFFGTLISLLNIYIKEKEILYFKNKDVSKSPYCLGKAGPYSLLDDENYHLQDILAIACGQSSLIVDVEKFYSLYGLDNEKFSQIMLNISKSFLSANSIQRRKSKDYFGELISMDKKNDKEFLEFSRNYIRFWNFGLTQPGIDSKLVLNMISEAKKKIEQFSIAEETIYKSCGMPLRFKLALSCAFKEAKENLSSAKYKSLEINSIEDIYKPKIKKEISERESITQLFNGGNDVTFHRNGDFSSEDILREISVILNTYNLPLFSYNFENLKGDMKITSFI